MWSATPNQFLVAEISGMGPGRAVDLACGEGRNAVWMAQQGWKVTGVDFSPVGLAKGRKLAVDRGVDVTWVESPVEDWVPSSEGFDLVVVFYLQLPQPSRSDALHVAASAVAPGGTLLVMAHDLDNLVRGVGGPQRPDVLYRVDEVANVAIEAGLIVQRAEQVVRLVDGDSGPKEAIDSLVRAIRPAASE